MSMTKSLFVPILVASIAFAGCVSKAELDATKQQLQAVTSERDNLKTQLEAAKQQTTGLTMLVNSLQTKLAAAAAALAAPPETGKGDKVDKKGGAGGKTGSPKPSESPKAPAP